ncbi:MAG TPA: ABC transporter ATP-binding protein [Thiotrichales bacterium]|nr:ABC transporter ATP-binding protein [Thiotrichales bacterium]
MNDMTGFSLEAQGLGKHYEDGAGHELHVLKGINFSIHAGDTIAIVGASGSGKTTLLNMLGGLDDASSGKVLLNGQDIEKLNEKKRSLVRNKHLGFVYQFHHLLPEFTALENVAMPLLIAGEKVSVATDRAATILTEIGLGKRMHHKPGELSGGERQRAAIVRAVIHQPDCVFADEPTGNLDRENAKQAIELIMQLNEKFKTALVIVTHDLEIAKKMKTVYTLDYGELINRQ